MSASTVTFNGSKYKDYDILCQGLYPFQDTS